MVIMHHPERDCIKKSPDYLWNYLPKEKSLFTNGEDRGVAIGNLFAQLFANFLLSKLDWRIDYYCKHHVRYVDDISFVARKKKTLLRLVPMIREILSSLDLRMNEKKFYLQHYTKGVRFTGAIVKRDRLYAVNTTIENYRKAVIRLNATCQTQDIEAVSHALRSVNSYLGIFGHYNEYGIKRQILKEELSKESWRYLVVKGRFRSIHLRRKFNNNIEYISTANKNINNGRKIS